MAGPDAFSRTELAAIERAAVLAWPALESVAIGGWLWRLSRGGSQRANSVAALADPDMNVEQAIDEVERRYGAQGAPSWFQVTDAAMPSDLDARLARRRYRLVEPCTTLAVRLVRGLTLPAGVEIATRAGPEWLSTYTGVISPDRRPVAPQIIGRIAPPVAFLSFVQDGRTLATALARPDGPVAVVECVATRASARRQGAAEAVMRGAMAWAAGQGAALVGLGAVAANEPAQRLYGKLGFRLAGRYHLRMLP
jgi:ribosomal protein S18 acetylase RimI-like enzyme